MTKKQLRELAYYCGAIGIFIGIALVFADLVLFLSGALSSKDANDVTSVAFGLIVGGLVLCIGSMIGLKGDKI